MAKPRKTKGKSPANTPHSAVDETQAPKPVGRPSLYSEELIATICARLSEGESLTQVCIDDAMPGYSTVMRWLAENPAFQEKYARACEIRGTLLFEECLKIADNATDFQKARLQFDARRWYLSKLVPKKYGDRTEVEHSGSVTLEGLIAASMQPAKPDGEPQK